MSKPFSVVLAGGGTAGHVNPLLATADGLRASDPQTRITALGTATGLEAELVPARGYELRTIARVPLPRRPSKDLLTLPARFRGAIRDVQRILTEAQADVVVGFGGFVATPAYVAARRLGLPIIIHEQNVRPGLANRLGARWARIVATSFADTPIKGGQHVGLPLRSEVEHLAAARAAGTDPATTSAALAELGLNPDLPVVLVTGGSLGAQRLNEAVVGALPDIAPHANIIHLTGKGKAEAALRAREELPEPLRSHYLAQEYSTAITDLFAVADLVVARAGAGTVAELTALGLPAIYVPLPIGNGEQERNIGDVLRAGGGMHVRDADLTPARLRDLVVPLLSDPDRLAAMANAARSVGRVDATAKLVALITQTAAEADAENSSTIHQPKDAE